MNFGGPVMEECHDWMESLATMEHVTLVLHKSSSQISEWMTCNVLSK